MPVNDALGTRMKTFYEQVPKTRLVRRMPVAIRIDGKAFHTFTRGFQKPFDEVLGNAMVKTMEYLCKNIQGCVFGYTQSDEITLLLVDYQTLETDAWFEYEVQKMCSISASMATMAFNKFFSEEVNAWFGEQFVPISEEVAQLYNLYCEKAENGAMFDARCFNIPREEVTNLIYWRQLDATRNSIQMVGQANFSHRELQGKSCNMIQDMLHEEKGINWNDFPTYLKRGSCVIKTEGKTTCAKAAKDGSIITWTADRPHWIVDRNIPIFKGEGREYIEKLIQPEEQ